MPARKSKPNPAAAAPPAIAVVVSDYNASITGPLLVGACAAYQDAGGSADKLHVLRAPGAFELVGLCLHAAQNLPVAGVVALGCIIQGDTIHDRVLADAVAGGLVGVTLRTGKPVSFGVLTVATPRQALERAGGKHGNKGTEAVMAVLFSLAAMEGSAENYGRSSLPDKAYTSRTPKAVPRHPRSSAHK